MSCICCRLFDLKRKYTSNGIVSLTFQSLIFAQNVIDVSRTFDYIVNGYKMKYLMWFIAALVGLAGSLFTIVGILRKNNCHIIMALIFNILSMASYIVATVLGLISDFPSTLIVPIFGIITFFPLSIHLCCVREKESNISNNNDNEEQQKINEAKTENFMQNQVQQPFISNQMNQQNMIQNQIQSNNSPIYNPNYNDVNNEANVAPLPGMIQNSSTN